MALSYGIRPRGQAERLKMALVLHEAPVVVEVQGDDGWAAACLALSGRLPVAGAGCDVPRIERTLRRLGLPRLGRALPAAVLTADLQLVGDAEPGREALPEVADAEPVTVLLCTRPGAAPSPATLASLRWQAVPHRVVHVAGPDVLAGEAATCGTPTFLVAQDGDVLQPGALRVLQTALTRHPELVAACGDVVLVESTTGVIRRWAPATTLPLTRALALPDLPSRPGATLVRTAVARAARPALGLLTPAFLHHLAAQGPVEAVPFPILVHPLAATPRPASLSGDVPTLPGLERVRPLAAPPTPAEALVLVDDGDVGALEFALERHAGGRALWVDIEVARDPLGPVRHHWPGTYAARERLHRWVTHGGPVHLRLSSAPDWAPPPVRGVGDLPDLPAPDAVLALAAALDWPLPARTRACHLKVAHPVARSMVHARLAIRKGAPRYAVNPLSQVLKLAPEWRLGWQLAADVFESLGYANEAASCRRQALNCRSVAA